MRLTEAIHFLTSEKMPSLAWMLSHYTHFVPTERDEQLRREYQRSRAKAKEDKRTKKGKQMKEIFT
jgi:hypothetical protein